MLSLMKSANETKLNEYKKQEWTKEDKRILAACIKKGATAKNIYQLHDLLGVTSGKGKGSGSASDGYCLGGAYGGASMTASGEACPLIFLCCLCFACFGMTSCSAKIFYNSCKNDYFFVRLAKVFLLTVSAVGLYMVSQDYIVEEIDAGISSSQNDTSSSSPSPSSESTPIVLVNNAIVIAAMLFGIPALMTIFSLLSPTQRFSLRDQLIAEGVSEIDKLMGVATDAIKPILVDEKHEFMAKTLLDLVNMQDGVKKASKLVSSLGDSGASLSNSVV